VIARRGMSMKQIVQEATTEALFGAGRKYDSLSEEQKARVDALMARSTKFRKETGECGSSNI
jgi:hypothetical protein